MSDPQVPTNEDWVCFDPLIKPPPKGKTLWVVNEGGSGYKGMRFPEAIAWANLPKLPQSVKDRMDAIAKQKQQSESLNVNCTELQEKQTG